jgi:hypothetical protein
MEATINTGWEKMETYQEEMRAGLEEMEVNQEIEITRTSSQEKWRPQ